MPETAVQLAELTQAKRSSHKPDNPSRESRPRTDLQRTIIATKSANPHMNNVQIAEIAATSRETVSRILTQYGTDIGAVEAYQKHRADILDALCQRLSSSVTDEDIKKANLLQRLSAYGIAYDKMRIERGLSDGTSKPLVMIQVNGQVNVHNPVDNTTLLTSPPSHNVIPDTQAIDIIDNGDSNV